MPIRSSNTADHLIVSYLPYAIGLYTLRAANTMAEEERDLIDVAERLKAAVRKYAAWTWLLCSLTRPCLHLCPFLFPPLALAPIVCGKGQAKPNKNSIGISHSRGCSMFHDCFDRHFLHFQFLLAPCPACLIYGMLGNE